MPNMHLTGDLTEKQKDEAVEILFEAFERKMQYLYLFQRDASQAKRILRKAIQFDQGVYAVVGGKVVGVAGLETRESGAFEQISFFDVERRIRGSGQSVPVVCYEYVQNFSTKT